MMKTIFESCQPRPEVLFGELSEDIFAARLRDVLEGNAEEVYQNPSVFFENTYPTDGLKLLIDEVLGRLTGVKPTSSPIIRLETAFGGGKTHNLIALYHLAKGGTQESIVGHIVNVNLLPKEKIHIAGVVGSDLDPANGLEHGDATTYTLWGEMAYQLKGIEGYRLLEASDKQRVAPSTQAIDKLISDAPTLIMLDELAHYFRVAKGMVGETSLAQQTIAFLNARHRFIHLTGLLSAFSKLRLITPIYRDSCR